MCTFYASTEALHQLQVWLEGAIPPSTAGLCCGPGMRITPLLRVACMRALTAHFSALMVQLETLMLLTKAPDFKRSLT